jgi:hypothetical protein
MAKGKENKIADNVSVFEQSVLKHNEFSLIDSGTGAVPSPGGEG